MLLKLPHKNRLLTLKMDPEVRDDVETRYNAYVKDLTQAVTDRDYVAAATATDLYMDFAKGKEAESKGAKARGEICPFGDKSKYYSSIQEELPALLIKDEVQRMISGTSLERENIVLGGQVCVIRQGVTPDLRLFKETKNIDFCLSAELKASPGHFIPLFGLEVKKYMDKTMFTTVMETVRSLSYLRPKTMYGFLIEEEARSPDVVLNSPISDREFILSAGGRTRTGRRMIQADVLENLHMTLRLWANQSIRQMNG